MEKYYVRETSTGEIILTNEDWFITTSAEHKEIWKENYLDEEVVEKKNFTVTEKHIEGDFFQVIAYPCVVFPPGKKRPSN